MGGHRRRGRGQLSGDVHPRCPRRRRELGLRVRWRTGAERWQYTYTDWSDTHVLQPYVWRYRVLANQWVEHHWFRSVIELDAATGEVAG